MMEDHFIEQNNGLNGMSADDGGSSDLDDGGSSDLDETEDQGSGGSDAFITPFAQYKPHDDHLGLRLRRHRQAALVQNASRRFRYTLDLKREEEKQQILRKIKAHAQAIRAAYLFQEAGQQLNDLAGVDGVSQMISPPTVIAEARTDCNLNLGTASFVTAGHTEQRSLLLDTPHRIDIQEGNSNDEEVHDWSHKMDFEWIFVITNIVLESISAIFTQLSSKQKPQYALFGVLLSYLALLTCIMEIIYEGHRHQQIPIWRGKSFATLNNIVALASALGQCVVTTINYSFQSPIKLTVLPIILAIGVLFSKILKYRQREREAL